MDYSTDNVILTTAGIAYLKAQALQSAPAQIGFFRLGDTNLFLPTPDMTDIQGALTHTGDQTQIWFNGYGKDEMIIRCIVDSAEGDFLIGNAGIYSTTGVLLFLCKFNYVHHKQKSVQSGPGGRWTYQIRILQKDLSEMWDFTNLVERYANTSTHTIFDAPQFPFESFYTEIRLNDSLLQTNREGYVLLSGETSRHWYANPLQMSMAWVDVFGQYGYDGGETGDFHEGVW